MSLKQSVIRVTNHSLSGMCSSAGKLIWLSLVLAVIEGSETVRLGLIDSIRGNDYLRYDFGAVPMVLFAAQINPPSEH
jgi:hypothetical protein